MGNEVNNFHFDFIKEHLNGYKFYSANYTLQINCPPPPPAFSSDSLASAGAPCAYLFTVAVSSAGGSARRILPSGATPSNPSPWLVSGVLPPHPSHHLVAYWTLDRTPFITSRNTMALGQTNLLETTI